MKTALLKLYRRLREPSSLAGLSVLLTLGGLPPGTVDAAVNVIGSVIALAAVVLPEGKSDAGHS